MSYSLAKRAQGQSVTVMGTSVNGDFERENISLKTILRDHGAKLRSIWSYHCLSLGLFVGDFLLRSTVFVQPLIRIAAWIQFGTVFITKSKRGAATVVNYTDELQQRIRRNRIAKYSEVQLRRTMTLQLLAMVARPGLTHLVLALIANGWVLYARIARAQTLALLEREFVLAARVRRFARADPVSTYSHEPSRPDLCWCKLRQE